MESGDVTPTCKARVLAKMKEGAGKGFGIDAFMPLKRVKVHTPPPPRPTADLPHNTWHTTEHRSLTSPGSARAAGRRGARADDCGDA